MKAKDRRVVRNRIVAALLGLWLGAIVIFGVRYGSYLPALWQKEHVGVFDDRYALDSKTYSSPSGRATLFVDPGQRSGSGPASYRCVREGQELWSGTRPYTLWEADVTDDGLVAGYAYAAGYMGGKDDALTVVLINPDGTMRLEERSQREGFLSDMGSPRPMAAGVLIDAENDRLIVRIKTESRWTRLFTESWWTYSLTTGEPGRRVDPRAGLPESARILQAARVVPGASLVLVNWLWHDYEAEHFGSVFTLLDPDGEVVWRLDWPTDHTVAGDDEATSRIQRELRQHGAILAVERGTFTLRQVATNERVTFEVEPAAGSRGDWKVREVARAPFILETSATSDAGTPPTLALTHLGSIQLGSPPSSPIRDVSSLALDGLGRPGFLRRTGERFEFVRVDRDGQNAVEIALPGSTDGEWWRYALAWTAGERWVATSSGTLQDLRPGSRHAWWIDAEHRTLTPIDGFDAPSIDSVAGTPDGGFVVVGATVHEGSFQTNDLVAFDRDGKRLFALGGDQGDPGNPRSVFPPEDMTVLRNGEIVVLSQFRNTLQFFSGTGEPLRRIELEDAWGRKPNYLVGVSPDNEVGLIVHDQNGKPSMVHTDGSGAVVGGFDPHYADGRAVGYDVQVGPDGSPWTSDGHSLLVLDRQGAVQRVVGPAPDAMVLEEVAGITVAPDDRIYAVDNRTHAVHVFNASGKLQHVCKPDARDAPRYLANQPLTVTDAGEVFLPRLHFAADGTRLGQVNAIGWHAQRGSDRFWRVGRDALHLIQSDGTIVRTIQRTPDDKWLRSMGGAGVAPDGSIALATVDRFGGIHIYTASGEAVRSLARPDGMWGWGNFAFDGERIAVGLRSEGEPGAVVLMDALGRALGRFQPAGEVPYWSPFFAAQGKELWLFDGEHRIERFALP